MNARRKLSASPLGMELVRHLTAEGFRVFTVTQAKRLGADIGLRESYFAQALHHLSRTGWVVPLKRGLYALSSSVPGVTAVHEFEIAMALVEPAAISHWSALHHHGLTEQIPRTVFVLTTTGTSIPQLRGAKAPLTANGYPVGDLHYRFIQVKSKYYFGFEKIWVGEARVIITDPERTLLDGLTRPQYCGDFAEVLHAFEVRRANLDLDRIIGYALRLEVATAKRLGWVLENQGTAVERLEPLRRIHAKGYRALDPTAPRQGPYQRRWMIQVNLPGKISS